MSERTREGPAILGGLAAVATFGALAWAVWGRRGGQAEGFEAPPPGATKGAGLAGALLVAAGEGGAIDLLPNRHSGLMTPAERAWAAAAGAAGVPRRASYDSLEACEAAHGENNQYDLTGDPEMLRGRNAPYDGRGCVAVEAVPPGAAGTTGVGGLLGSAAPGSVGGAGGAVRYVPKNTFFRRQRPALFPPGTVPLGPGAMPSPFLPK